MSSDQSDTPPVESPLAQLERGFIVEFVRARGLDPLRLHEIAESDRQALLAEASVYASAKLSEVESRSRFVHEMHQVRPGHSQTGLD